MASGSGYTDYRNNVIYNWGYQNLYGGERFQQGNDQFNFSEFNIVANYYKPGPATEPGEVSDRIANPSFRDETNDYGKWYIANNVVEGNAKVSKDNWNGGVQTELPFDKIRRDHPWPSMPIYQHTAEDAYKAVLDKAGAVLPERDPIDTRIIREVREGYATYEGRSYKQEHQVADPRKICGIIDTQEDVGGWPELKSKPAPQDTDHDGMPDDWERNNGLDPDNPDDRNKIADDGYTMLERYLNTIG
jgi:pectate lyase